MHRPAATLALLLVLAGGCATLPGPVDPARDSPAPPVEISRGGGKGRLRSPGDANDRRFANPSGAEIAQILDESGLKYETVDPGKRWMIAFAGEHLQRVVLYVIHGEAFTIVLGKLFTTGAATNADFYRALARKNYEFDQLKLSVDVDGGVFASFEVPTRIVDKRELLENIFGLASAIDNVLPELVELGDPVAPPDDDTEEPATPGEPKPVTPAKDAPIIEARRGGGRP